MGLLGKHEKEWREMYSGVKVEYVKRGVLRRLKSWSGYW